MNQKKSAVIPLHLMMLPGCILLLIFSYAPMFGVVMAFQNFVVTKGFFGSTFVGLENFIYMFKLPNFARILRNTLVISAGKLVLSAFVSISFAILLNEIRISRLKRFIQTVTYLPHFLSWVVLASVVVNMFSLDGAFNQALRSLGLERINFLGSNTLFQPMLVITDVWKGFGYGSIVYLAAITSIDPGQYESAAMDGAGWWRKVWSITLPGMMPIILLMNVMHISSILNAGFDQIYNLYSPMVYETGDILDTYVYRIGLIGRQYSLGASVGLFKSIIGMFLLLTANAASKRFTESRIF
ncbi:MAG: ABC transporter permease subunit [Clostridiales bacterium]|jgi:putative aldouronate transport system permease protein|nr:ABC transporter permease subunit [Clostridiales bacterium]